MTLFEKLRTRTIMLLDPDPWVRESLILLFQCEACRLLAFENVVDGLRALESGRFEIIICDYEMPGMDGISFLRQAGRSQPDAIRILLANYPVGEVAELAAREGIHDCLLKPLNLDALDKTFRGIVDRMPPESGQGAKTAAQ